MNNNSSYFIAKHSSKNTLKSLIEIIKSHEINNLKSEINNMKKDVNKILELLSKDKDGNI